MVIARLGIFGAYTDDIKASLANHHCEVGTVGPDPHAPTPLIHVKGAMAFHSYNIVQTRTIVAPASIIPSINSNADL